MTAKEYLFSRYPDMEESWDMTANDDMFLERMMEDYHEYRMLEYKERERRKGLLIEMMKLDEESGMYQTD